MPTTLNIALTPLAKKALRNMMTRSGERRKEEGGKRKVGGRHHLLSVSLDQQSVNMTAAP